MSILCMVIFGEGCLEFGIVLVTLWRGSELKRGIENFGKS